MFLSKQPKILSNAASSVFGLPIRFILDDGVLEATLRYISIKNGNGDIENTNFIKARLIDNVRGNIAPSRYLGSEINILRISNGYEASLVREDEWISLDQLPYPTASFLSQYSQTSILVNKEKHCAVILVKNTTDKWRLAFCSTLYRVLAWLYPIEEKPSQEEIAIFRAISQENEDEFISIVDSCCEGIDFENIAMKKVLLGWISRNKLSKLEDLRRDRESLEYSIRDLENTLSQKYKDLNYAITIISQLMSMVNEKDSLLYDFFNSHKQLRIISSENTNTVLRFSILETLEYFDEDEFMKIFNEKRSVFYNNTTELARRVAYEIFINKRGKFQVESVFTLKGITGLSPVSGSVSGFYNDISMPHPHLYHHACLGGNGQYITEYLRKGDWDLAIEQAIAATKNLRFSDATVFGEFLRDIETYKEVHCIVLEDGNRITPIDFYKLGINGKKQEEEQ